MTTALYTDERTFWHTCGAYASVLPVGGWVQPPNGSGNIESPDSKRRILSLIQVSGLCDKIELRGATPATTEDLLRVHPTSYLDRFKTMSDAGGGELDRYGTIGRGSYEIACISAGLTTSAVDAVVRREIDNGYALSRPPGHHCSRDTAMGFCLLANIPIAIEAARAKHGLQRVTVVDWDVHHGNGTQSIYYDDPNTLTISLHQDRCFPFGYSGADERGEGRGLGANINIPLPPGCGNDAYLYAFDRIVLPALDAFRPELIVAASGLDANVVDPLSRMLLHSNSYRDIVGRMMAAADKHCGGRLALSHEGGYAEAYVPFCGLAIMETLAGFRTEVEDPMLKDATAQQPGERAFAFQRQWIDELAESHGY